MPNNLKVLSIHESMLKRRIPPGTVHFTSTNPVEFSTAVNGFGEGSHSELSEKMAKSLIAQNGRLNISSTLRTSGDDEIVRGDNVTSSKDAQFHWNRFPKDAARETQEKKATHSETSWKSIDIDSCLSIQSHLPRRTPLVGLNNHLFPQHEIFEMHNITVVHRDKCDTSVIHAERLQAKAASKLPLFKLLLVTGHKGVEFGEFDEPVGVAFNPHGEIIVADYNNDRFQVLSSDGETVRVHDHYSRESGKKFSFISPTGIACDSAGNVVVVEKARNRVVVLSPSGTILHSFGRHGTEPGQFRGPHGVSVDARSRIIVTDTMNCRIQVFDHEGNFLFMFGDKGPGKLNYPCYALFHAGRFYVADTDNDCVKVFDTRGTFVRKLDEGFNAPSGIVVHKDTYLLVCDYSNDCVKVFSFDGRMLNKIGSSGEGKGQFFGPEAVAASPEGKIVVTDKLNCRLQILDLIN